MRCQHAEVIDRVIAIVNDDIITMKDFEAFMKIERRQSTKFTSIDEYFRNLQMRQRLETYIEGDIDQTAGQEDWASL